MEIGSGERTEREWHALVESAGLKILRIWTAQKGRGLYNVVGMCECFLLMRLF